MNVVKRLKEPTPSFFKKVRNIGLTLVAISTAVVTAPVALPVALVQVAGYLAVAGGVASAVSQVVTEGESSTPAHGH